MGVEGPAPSWGSDPLLVVIDMQLIFAAGALWATPGFEALEAPLRRLVEAFGDRVVFTRFVLPEQQEGSWSDYYQLWSEVTRPEAAPLLELAEPWRGLAGQPLDKTTFSKWGPELRERAGAGRTLVLAGVATDCCILATALAAVDEGMYVRVVGDACAGVTVDAHQRVLELLPNFAPQARVTTSDQELSRLARGRGQ